MRISDWSSDVCSSDLKSFADELACGISDRRDARSIIVGERSLDENGARQEAATKNIVFQNGVNSRRCGRSEEHTSELQSLMRISYAVFCLKKKTQKQIKHEQSLKHKLTTNHIVNNINQH